MEDSQTVNSSLKKAINRAFTSGYQLDKESFVLLQELAQENKRARLVSDRTFR